MNFKQIFVVGYQIYTRISIFFIYIKTIWLYFCIIASIIISSDLHFFNAGANTSAVGDTICTTWWHQHQHPHMLVRRTEY